MRRRGFTLVEALVAAGLMTIIFAGAYQLQSTSERAFERISKDLEVQARWAPVQERLVRDLRRARSFRTPGGEPSNVVMIRTAKAGAPEEELRFEPGGRVVRVVGQAVTVLGKDLPLDELVFEALRDSPTALDARLLSIRARLTWTDATRRTSTLSMQTRVMARNAPLSALQFEEEVVE